jgi:hypothetical protein
MTYPISIQNPAPQTDDAIVCVLRLVEKIDAAIMVGGIDEAAALIGDWHTLARQLNGNEGIFADTSSAEYFLLEKTAAKPGETPLWGQWGQFAIEVGGIFSLVTYHGPKWGPTVAHMEFRALELALPYLSATGYRSHFFSLPQVAGLTVREAAEAAMLEFVRKQYRIERNARLEAETLTFAALPWVKAFMTALTKPGLSQGLQLSMF